MKRILQLFASKFEENRANIRIIAGPEQFEETYVNLLIPQFLLNSKSLIFNNMSFQERSSDSKHSEVVLSCIFVVFSKLLSTLLFRLLQFKYFIFSTFSKPI